MKDKTTAALLAIFLGGLGVHKFYLNRILQGVIYLLFSWTFIPLIIGFIEGIIYLCMDNTTFNNKYNKSLIQPNNNRLSSNKNLSSKSVNNQKRNLNVIKPLIIVFSIIFVIVGIIIYINFNYKKNLDKTEKENKTDSIYRSELLVNGWNKLEKDKKKGLIDSLINSKIKFYQDKRNEIGTIMYKSLQHGVKYPSTLKVDDETPMYRIYKYNFEVLDYDKGEISCYKSFTSENKLSMTVKGTIDIIVIFDGEKIKLKDIKIY